MAWSLPARDNTWRTKLLMECPLQWPVRKCHWTQGRTQRHLFQLGGHLNVKIVVFLSFEDFYRSLRTNKVRGMGDSLKGRFLQWSGSYWASVNVLVMPLHSLSWLHSVGSALGMVQFSLVQSLSRVRLFATPWIAACQASLSITNSFLELVQTHIH